MTAVGPGWKRTIWSAGGQALSSITNFGLGAGLAASGSTADLGRAMSVISVYFLVLTVGRALFAESLVASVESSSDQWRWVRRRLLLLGGLATPASAVVGLMVGLGLGSVLVISLSMVPLMLQDGYRYLAWNRGRPGVAALIDGVWVGTSGLLALGLLLAGFGASTLAVTAVWSLGGIVSLVAAPSLIGRSGSPIPSTVRSDRHRELAYSQSLGTASFNLIPVALALIFSPEFAGLAKAVVLPFSPWLSVVGGLRMVTLSSVTRWRLDPTRAGRSPALTQVMMATPVTVVAALGLLVSIGYVTPYVESLREAAPYLWFGLLLCLLYVAAQLLADGLALGPARERAVRIRLLTLGLEWIGLFVGAALGGAYGMLVGWTAALAISVVVWLVETARGSKPGDLPIPDYSSIDRLPTAGVEAPTLDGCSPDHLLGLSLTRPAPTNSRTQTVG